MGSEMDMTDGPAVDGTGCNVSGLATVDQLNRRCLAVANQPLVNRTNSSVRMPFGLGANS
jgi:hypothetical protein